jgi:predicted DCC family thiol-disulfide oxidoreductase YuxK
MATFVVVITGVDGDLVLLFDGMCAVCSRAVQFVLARDRVGTMRFAPLQGETAQAIRASHHELSGVDALVLVERGRGSADRIWIGSEAVLRVAEYLGGRWRAAAVFRMVPPPLRRWAYAAFAARRHRVGRHLVQYPIPDPRTRERFLP